MSSLLRVARQPMTGAGRRFFAQNVYKADSKFYKECMHHIEAHGKQIHVWRNATLFGVIPAIALLSVYMYYLEEKKHGVPRKEYIEYDFLAVRNKPFPWGDGNHSLFHNPVRNWVPGVGYEAPDPALSHDH